MCLTEQIVDVWLARGDAASNGPNQENIGKAPTLKLQYLSLLIQLGTLFFVQVLEPIYMWATTTPLNRAVNGQKRERAAF